MVASPAVLAGLGRMNACFGGHRAVIKALQYFQLEDGSHISDWGCGGGDALIATAIWAKKNNKNLKFIGMDAAATAIRFAEKLSAPYTNITYLQVDVLTSELTDKGCDVVISSLFTHHVDDEQWVKLIKKMYAAAALGVIITDLDRHWLLYYAVKLIVSVSGSKMARYDGSLSLRKPPGTSYTHRLPCGLYSPVHRIGFTAAAGYSVFDHPVLLVLAVYIVLKR